MPIKSRVYINVSNVSIFFKEIIRRVKGREESPKA